jgi:hypothetical protein
VRSLRLNAGFGYPVTNRRDPEWGPQAAFFSTAFPSISRPDPDWNSTTPTPPASRRPGRADAAAAGGYVVGSMVLCGAIGLGLGSLVGLSVALGLVGLFAGLGVGLALVYARFRTS